VDTQPTVETNGQAVTGNWGDMGTFSLAADFSTLDLEFNDPANALSGTISFKNLGTPARTACNGTTKGSPYFDSLSTGQTLNEYETDLYENLGWAIAMPRASANVDLKIDGKELKFNNAPAYHDHNWLPSGVDKFLYTWIVGLGSCGPYDVSFVEVQALDSSLDKDIVSGFLTENGQFLHNQCYIRGNKAKVDTMEVRLTGQEFDPLSGVDVPTGWEVEFVLDNGKEYFFKLDNTIQNPARSVYHRWHTSGSGGEKGGKQYECFLTTDWLNPGLAVYEEGKNIFDTQ
jgi:hypothetical protein